MIGTYHFIAAFSPDGPLYYDVPIYGYRKQYLPMVHRVATQVLLSNGSWINVSPEDVNLL